MVVEIRKSKGQALDNDAILDETKKTARLVGLEEF
jgi:hypothetical protein